MDVLLFGPPGAGKGTQASAICARLEIPQVATGDMFRRHLKEGTELGKLAESFMNEGKLVPDQVVCDIVTSRLLEDDAKGGVLLDGFPRTVPQAELLMGWLRDNDRKIDVVVSIEVPDAMVQARLTGRRTCLSCGATYHIHHNPTKVSGTCDRCGEGVVQREDDTDAKVSKRIATYHEQTAPVLAWLQGRAQIVSVDGAKDIGVVRTEILDAIKAV